MWNDRLKNAVKKFILMILLFNLTKQNMLVQKTGKKKFQTEAVAQGCSV